MLANMFYKGNVPIKQGNDVAFVNWEKQKNELIVQPTGELLKK